MSAEQYILQGNQMVIDGAFKCGMAENPTFGHRCISAFARNCPTYKGLCLASWKISLQINGKFSCTLSLVAGEKSNNKTTQNMSRLTAIIPGITCTVLQLLSKWRLSRERDSGKPLWTHLWSSLFSTYSWRLNTCNGREWLCVGCLADNASTNQWLGHLLLWLSSCEPLYPACG